MSDDASLKASETFSRNWKSLASLFPAYVEDVETRPPSRYQAKVNGALPPETTADHTKFVFGCTTVGPSILAITP